MVYYALYLEQHIEFFLPLSTFLKIIYFSLVWISLEYNSESWQVCQFSAWPHHPSQFSHHTGAELSCELWDCSAVDGDGSPCTGNHRWLHSSVPCFSRRGSHGDSSMADELCTSLPPSTAPQLPWLCLLGTHRAEEMKGLGFVSSALMHCALCRCLSHHHLLFFQKAWKTRMGRAVGLPWVGSSSSQAQLCC